MSRAPSLLRSTLLMKAVMAVTGLMLFGFVVAHMTGNLKVFLGAEAINHYAEWLREVGEPLFPHTTVLWILRVGLLAAVALHVASATQLTLINRRARPRGYERLEPVQLDYASRTMRWSGVLILLYVGYHLMHLTWGNVHADFVPGDVHHNLVVAFREWPIAAVYVTANVALGFHLYHGLWSLFQSLGIDHPLIKPWRRPFAVTFAVVVTLGYVAVPIGILAGLVGPRGGA
ncbi:MAG TPA: succinate dehydrogenase cytochrome b subunit [Thermoanaerobaculia bacterium]|nr:succinate dehydrogenase cytochrome b subunit [Thermoanaerobaculia bacterium]